MIPQEIILLMAIWNMLARHLVDRVHVKHILTLAPVTTELKYRPRFESLNFKIYQDGEEGEIIGDMSSTVCMFVLMARFIEHQMILGL